ncbi:MAG: hypothetical protein IH859_01595 [Chloroflexi bacterium]|nr:hypothetical protein [Chloroflexota bacterium]
MHRWLVILFIGAVFIVGCTSTTNHASLPISDLPTIGPTKTSLPASTQLPPTLDPTTTPLSPNFGPPETATPFVVASFAEFPGNLAQGELAADFSARLIDGSLFTLSEYGDRYLLLFPTVVGCGECVFGIHAMALALEPFLEIETDGNFQILVMDLYPGGDPLDWEYFTESYPHPNIIWGVVASDLFAVDYEILTLGSIFLINPQGNIVFRSEYALPPYQFEKLFELILEA